MKEGGSTVPTANRSGGANENVEDLANIHRRRPETNTTEAEGTSSQRGPRRGVRLKPKATATSRNRQDEVMLRVRQDIRQPVTSLWQTAAERASTAPTRTAAHGGGMVDCTNTTGRRGLSRRSHSQLSVARANRDKGCADASTGVADECLHAGGRGAVSSAGGAKTGASRASRGRSSREKPATSNTAATKTLSLVDSANQGKRTQVPLRSSHRVGPVGSLGEPRLAALALRRQLLQLLL